MADLSIEGLANVVLAAVEDYKVEVDPENTDPGNLPLGMRQRIAMAVIAALAEAAGDPEALGRVLVEAAMREESLADDPDLLPWDEWSDEDRAASSRVAQAVAACAVAAILRPVADLPSPDAWYSQAVVEARVEAVAEAFWLHRDMQRRITYAVAAVREREVEPLRRYYQAHIAFETAQANASSAEFHNDEDRGACEERLQAAFDELQAATAALGGGDRDR